MARGIGVGGWGGGECKTRGKIICARRRALHSARWRNLGALAANFVTLGGSSVCAVEGGY